MFKFQTKYIGIIIFKYCEFFRKLVKGLIHPRYNHGYTCVGKTIRSPLGFLLMIHAINFALKAHIVITYLLSSFLFSLPITQSSHRFSPNSSLNRLNHYLSAKFSYIDSRWNPTAKGKPYIMSSSLLDSADPVVFAEKWSSKIAGTRYLIFRDLPELIKKHICGTRTLDYGCGSGVSTNFLSGLGLEMDGVDISKEMIAKCTKEDPTGHYRVIRSGEIPAVDQTYDFVFSSCVFMYVSTKRELVKIFAEVARILKAEGCFIGVVVNETFYNHEWATYNTQFKENENTFSGAQVKMVMTDVNFLTHHYYWTEKDYKEVCDRSGLTIVETHRPLGRDEDGFPWVREKEFSPFVILVMKKIQVS